MKKTIRLLALLLTLVMLLASCNVGGDKDTTTESASATESATESVVTTGSETDTEETTEQTEQTVTTESQTETEEETESKPPYRDSVSRTREELESMMDLSNEHFTEAEAKLAEFESLAVISTDYDAVDALYLEFEDMFYHIDTQLSIASVIYYLDMKDEAASDRYLDSYDKYGDLYNKYIEVCKNAYEKSPIRDQLFADWTEEDIKELFAYDPESQELREKNEEILVQINELTGDDADEKTAQLYAQMVTNNNRIAELAGYDNYYDYASVEIYGRDYSTEEIATFKANVIKYFSANLDKLYSNWYGAFSLLGEEGYNTFISFLYDPFDELGENHLLGYVNSFEGSTYEGFSHMFENRNMIFSNSPDSHQSAFQTYFEELETPFCLFGADGQNTSAIVHEMGHYYAALHHPDVTSFDIAETQSQTNELLLLRYMDGKLPYGVYRTLKGYTVYNFAVQSIVCVMIDEFEQKVYSLDSVEGYGSAEFDAIMAEVCEQYGGVDYVNENITDMNYYWRAVATNSPVYYISYATSMIESLNIYAIAVNDEAAGREMYRKLVEDVTEDDGFKSAMVKIGLTDPFSEQTFIGISALLP
ncbi:MAG: hypothetical protein E7649_06990 [Ruminococcaceae bacterium]|nr:hypothetical protein [Oscillospiraceae bacterium]